MSWRKVKDNLERVFNSMSLSASKARKEEFLLAMLVQLEIVARVAGK